MSKSKTNGTSGGTAVAEAPATAKRKNADAVPFKRLCEVLVPALVLKNKNAQECAAELGMDPKNFNQRQTSWRKLINEKYPKIVELMVKAGNPKMYLKSNRGGKIDQAEANDFLTSLIENTVASKDSASA